jgi:hypothetical protein
VKGKPTIITVDDYLPVKGAKTKSLAYSHASPDGAIWGPLLEKAFAKASGTYHDIVAGSMIEAFNFLTGAPGKRYSLKEYGVDQTW